MKIRNLIFYLFYFFAFGSLCYGVYVNNYRIMFICMFTLFLFLLLDFLIKSFDLKVSFHFKLLIFLFLLCSEIFGEAFSFYSIISYWDDILHFTSGCMVSYLGFLIFNRYIKIINHPTVLMCMIFCFCFSVSFGVFWEFLEFGFDKYLESDMQKDIFLNKFNTTYFDSTNNLTHIDNIIKTEIYTSSGVISIGGSYLDIGLYDTITDLLIDSLGAISVSLIIGYCLIKKT